MTEGPFNKITLYQFIDKWQGAIISSRYKTTTVEILKFVFVTFQFKSIYFVAEIGLKTFDFKFCIIHLTFWHTVLNHDERLKRSSLSYYSFTIFR